MKENKHLPEIPSEKEMQKDGLSMNEFQSKLLQKTEELTLYIIDLKKENLEQNKKIQDLEKNLLSDKKKRLSSRQPIFIVNLKSNTMKNTLQIS